MNRIHRIHDPQEHRHRIPWQLRHCKVQQRVIIEPGPLLRRNKQCRAPRPSVVSGDQHAVDVSLDDAGETAEDGGDFGRADVFRFPAICIAEPVEEEPAAVCVATEGVAGAVPEVALSKNVPDEFFRGGGRVVPVAGKGLFGGDLDDDFAALGVGLAGGEAGDGVADDVVGRRVDGDGDVDVAVEEAQEGAVVADAAG